MNVSFGKLQSTIDGKAIQEVKVWGNRHLDDGQIEKVNKFFEIRGSPEQLSEMSKLITEIIENRFNIYGCERLIPKGKLCPEHGNGEINVMLKKAEDGMLSNSVSEQLRLFWGWVHSLEFDKIFSTNNFKTETRLQTFGDVSKAPLDLAVCLGELRKVKFSRGRYANRYVRDAQFSRCGFLEENQNGGFICNNKKWIDIQKASKGDLD